MADVAIEITNVYKSYGKQKVLKDLCMTVPRGAIYGLLGASGCGKTTLLNGIVGLKNFDNGDVSILGRKMTKSSKLPGTLIGYMPQDIALVAEFTVKDAIFYFGRIINIPDATLNARLEELKLLLDLPDEDRLIKNCSGGQQRRISLACAMVHNPAIMILDEPTVGLDPLLRDRIWNHLVKISKEQNVSIIITTHYIEETRNADRIGLMRNGYLLAEESPKRLMELFQTTSLEEVFLKLSRQQEDNNLNCSINASPENGMMLNNIPQQTIHTKSNRSAVSHDLHFPEESDILNAGRLKALLHKNFKQYGRNYGAISFTIIFPILEIMAFLLAVGGDVKGINLGIINNDICNENYLHNNTAVPYSWSSCRFSDLGCRFIKELEDPMIDKKEYNDIEKAIADIRVGNIIGVVYVNDQFTEAFDERFNNLSYVSDEMLEKTKIKVWLDLSNRQIGYALKFKLIDKYLEFQKNLLEECRLPRQMGDVPMRFDYEYGDPSDSYTDFMIPGVLLTCIFFLATTSSSTIIINDRQEGVWDRSIVAGVSSLEIVITHFVLQILLIAVQVCEVIIATFLIYGADFAGSMTLIFLMTALQGISGMCFGFWVSVVSDSHSAANVVTTGAFYPMIALCGMIWPLEGQPLVLRIVSQCLPFTYPIVSLRQVIKKGLDLKNLEVSVGFAITIAWICFLVFVSLCILKRNR